MFRFADLPHGHSSLIESQDRMYLSSPASVSLAAVAIAVGLILLPAPAHAQYLDPGAGSMIVQVVIALAVGLGATLKIYWRRVSGVFARRSKNRPAA